CDEGSALVWFRHHHCQAGDRDQRRAGGRPYEQSIHRTSPHVVLARSEVLEIARGIGSSGGSCAAATRVAVPSSSVIAEEIQTAVHRANAHDQRATRRTSSVLGGLIWCIRPCAIASTRRALRRAWTGVPSDREPAYPDVRELGRRDACRKSGQD